MQKEIVVIGAGLAGCEAAWQIAKNNINVKLVEMKPAKMTEVHKYNGFAELVCSNSLKAKNFDSASGLLKEELRIMGSLIIEAADKTQLPAGGALAVDREKFSDYITNKIKENTRIQVECKEVAEIPKNQKVIIATGPLTAEALQREIAKTTGEGYLHFYDAASPIIIKESIDFNKAFYADRYNKGNDDYINCPMNREEYMSFYNALIEAETALLGEHEKKEVFEGCMPVEIMAKSGIETLRFGPMKPVGIKNPNNGQEYYAIVQLRQDNMEATLFNIVGFQTNLKFSEQKKVFRMIPGLEKAEFARYGVMHRNTFLNSPKILDCYYRMNTNKNIYFAGQITGVEGYVESVSAGLVAGINASNDILNKDNIKFSNQTAIGALAGYVSSSSIGDFQPMGINFGIISYTGMEKIKKAEKKALISNKAIDIIKKIKSDL